MRILHLVLLLCFTLNVVLGRHIVKRNCCSGCKQCNSNCQPNCNSCQSNCDNCQSNCNNCQSNCNDCQSNCNNCQSSCNDCQSNCNNCQPNCKDICQEQSNCDSADKEGKIPVLIPFPPPQQTAVSPQNNTNVNNYNFTTDIQVTNIINTVNNFTIPIVVKTTSENHVLPDAEVWNKASTNPDTNPAILNDEINPLNQNCCIVIHPKLCDRNGYCFFRSHTECSSICTGQVVTITGYQPQGWIPPYQPVQNCQDIRNYPYRYCGNYQTQSCGGCYFCDGNFNPQQCISSPECPNACQGTTRRCIPYSPNYPGGTSYCSY